MGFIKEIFEKDILNKNKSDMLSKHWCGIPAFKERLRHLLHYMNSELSNQSAFGRLKQIKICFRNAALHSRNAQSYTDANGNESFRLILESISRALWSNDTKLARTLIRSTSLASLFIHVDQGKVTPIYPEALEKAYSDEKLAS